MPQYVPYDESRHVAGMPAPLNGPSMALGSPRDLDRLVRRLDLIDQDVIELHARQGIRQDSLASLLDVTTQSGISMRLQRARLCLQHLALEPVPVEEALLELVYLLPEMCRLPAVTWAITARAASWCMTAHGLPVHLGKTLLSAVREVVSSGAGSERLRSWAAWRLRMPRRFDFPSLRGKVRAPPRPPIVATAEQVRVASLFPAKEAMRILGVSRTDMAEIRRQAGPSLASRGDWWWSTVDRAALESVAHLPTYLAARAAGVSDSTVRTFRRRTGAPSVPQSYHHRGRTDHVVPEGELRRRVALVAGMGLAEAALVLGCAESSVSRWRKRVRSL